MYVQLGKIDCGITGKDFAVERGFPVHLPNTCMDLGFAKSRLCVAVPKESPLQRHEELRGLRIATSFPSIVGKAFGPETQLVQLEGAVEISVTLGTYR
jgi:ATP phosphoribosyltransferase